MKLLGKRILLHSNTIQNSLGLDQAEDFKVAYIGDEVTKVEVGDTVIYEHGAKLNIQGKDYIELMEENIVCIL